MGTDRLAELLCLPVRGTAFRWPVIPAKAGIQLGRDALPEAVVTAGIFGSYDKRAVCVLPWPDVPVPHY